MPTQFLIGVDWRRKGLICWEAQVGDALNILPNPLRYNGIAWRNDTASSVNRQHENSDYGLILFAVQTGTGVNNGFVLGQSDALVVNTIPVSPSNSYSASARVKGISGYAAVPLILRVKDQTGATLATSSPLNLSSTWQTLTVSFSTGTSSSYIYIEVVKDNNAINTLFHVTGFMLVAGSQMPSGYNTGEEPDLYDNLANRVLHANWFLGMRKPYQDVADDTMLELVLNNSDKRYSPEYVSSPLAGYLVSFRPIQVRSDDGISLRQHFTGWIESLEPSVNQFAERQVKITCAGPMQFFKAVETQIAIQENKRSDEIIAALVQEVLMPPPLLGSAIIDLPESVLDSVDIVGGTALPSNLQVGKSSFAYAADNWVRETEDGKTTSFNVYRAIRDIVMAERGRFFFNRDGEAVFWNRHHLITNQDLVATFDNSMMEMRYTFASLGEFANDIKVGAHPRSISAGENDLLWSLEEPISLEPGAERELGAAYRDESENRIGGRKVKLANISFKAGSGFVAGSLFLEKAGANRARLRFRNPDKKKKVVLEAAELRGQKISDFGQSEATARDGLSILTYGQREMRWDLRSVDKQEAAQGIADFELIRRKQPSGKVTSIGLRSHGKNSDTLHEQQLARTIGERIRVKEAQSGHDGDYFIIGEAHRLSDAGTNLETTWYLESATEGNWCVIDSSEIDSGAILLPY